MISIPFLVCLIGLAVWLIFTKWKKVADSWVAEVGRICFILGLFWTLAPFVGRIMF